MLTHIRHSERVFIMKRLLLILILTLTFQSWTIADKIKDYEMDNMMVGDSLLKHYNSSELEIALESVTYYPKSKKFKVVFFKSKTKEYDIINVSIKDKDQDYVIYGLRGEKEMPLTMCKDMKDKQVKDIEEMINYKDKQEYIGEYGNDYGNSKAHITDFTLKDGSLIRIFCADFDNNNENVKNNLWKDSLEVGINSKEYADFLTYEAY